MLAWWQARTNLMESVWMLQTNVNDIRLRFRWPVLPSGVIPNAGLATFRAMADGAMLQTNAPVSQQPLYFVQPSLYFSLPNGVKP
jgi:hypothetical protein